MLNRVLLALVVLLLCVNAVDAGPILDRVRERREARLNGGPIFPRLSGNAGVTPGYGGCANGQCPQVVQGGTVYYTLPASGGCVNGNCPLPAKK